MPTKAKLAALLSAKFLLTGWMLAQSTPQPTSGNGLQDPTQQSAPVSSSHMAAPENEEQPHTAPVLWISSVEVMRSTHAPQLDVIRVRGLASTEGWEHAELVPLTRGIPADGILDLALVAEAPSDSSTPVAYPEMEAVFAMEPGHPFHGVRVHGAINRVAVNTLPGYAASVTPPKDCAACIGKLFVPTGHAAPAGIASEVVREEELPRSLRLIHEGDGLGSLDSDPNRMTVMLNEKGQILMALWD